MLPGEGGFDMYTKQSDLLKGLSRDFVEKVMEVAEKEAHKRGYLLCEPF